jgi:ubiquinone/menaquinone biosynthesis C-methylase UbiE
MSDLSLYKNSSINIILSLNTSLSFAEDINKVLSEIHRVLHKDGIAFLSVLNQNSLRRTHGKKYKDIKKNKVELYKTRGTELSKNSTPAHVYSINKLYELSHYNKFKIKQIYGMSFFGGVYKNPKIWFFDILLSKFYPNKCHYFNFIIEKE